MTDEITLLRQFRDSIATISLTAPTGANNGQWSAQKLRELRRVARIYRDQSATPNPDPADRALDPDVAFVRAALDFSDAGPEKFKPGYDQHRDVCTSAARLADRIEALSSRPPEAEIAREDIEAAAAFIALSTGFGHGPLADDRRVAGFIYKTADAIKADALPAHAISAVKRIIAALSAKDGSTIEGGAS